MSRSRLGLDTSSLVFLFKIAAQLLLPELAEEVVAQASPRPSSFA